MKRKFHRVYQFKISLKGIKPVIWRQIEVPETYSFWDLHVAIQDAMGWQDYHLHQFEVTNPASGQKVEIGIPDEESEWERAVLPGWKCKIADYFSLENRSADYLYDFGDGWQHAIRLEEIVPREKDVDYPRCLAGKRACPPEDCGGVWGYEEFLAAIRNPDHEEHEAMLEWVGGGFDPEAFDPGEVSFDDPRERWRIAFAED